MRSVPALVKNTLVFDLKRSAAEVWLVGPLARDLLKNTTTTSVGFGRLGWDELEAERLGLVS
jgi:hypothetical protein